MEWLGDFPHDHTFVDLLMPDVPDEVDLQLLIRETEEKLRLNASSIEQNLRELQGKIGEAWIGERAPSPTECLQWFSQRNLSSLKPTSTGHQELLDFLKALQHLLKTEEAREDVILQLLLNISSQCGVAFPSSGTLSEQSHIPCPPICSVRDDLALEVQQIWDDVRLLLRHHLLQKLQSAEEPGQSAGDSNFGLRLSQRILILQQLFFLYPEAEVLAKYQSLQSKTVLGLLRRTQTCSPGGERGFDRLALDFQASSTTFCSMVGEEIRVLNGVAEPHSILAFLNQAYLSTLAQELSTLMEREVEAALKDNATHGGKTGKSSSKKSAVAPQEAPQRVRNFCLTSHQLKCLTQLASTLLEMERSVENLATDLGFLNCAGESACSLKGILKKVRDDVEMLDGKATPDLLLQNAEAVCLEFEWRPVFRELVPQMAHCVKVFLEEVCSKSLQQEETTYRSSSALITLVSISLKQGAELTCPEKEMPKMIAKFCADVLEELDALLPLALACKDDGLLHVRSCYVEVCGRVTSALLTRLEDRSGQVPSSAPLKNFPILLASSIYIQQRLRHYESQLRDSTRVPLTLLPIQRSQDVTAAVHEHLTSYCVHVCATSILQDAESHYWTDPKPFYEGERCSFSIQMWHYFLWGLRSDLWKSVSPALAQQTLAQVLSQTLELLLQRYCRAQPSYKRLPQIRVDITAILLCVEELIWSLCSSVEELVRPCQTPGSWVSCIHSLCDQLLYACIILTAPLPHLYSTFQNGLIEGRANNLEEKSSRHTSFWLSVINPTLFPKELLRECVADEGSAVCLLKLASSGPCCCPVLVLQAILHSDCLMLRLLFSHSHLCLDSEIEVSHEAQKAAAEFVEAVFTILSSLNNVPRALAVALEGYLDRRHLWDHFYSLADATKEAPVLFKCIRAAISKPITSLIEHLVYMMQTCEELPGMLIKQDLPESILAKIPKEWNYTPQEAKAKHTSKNAITLAIQALSFIFTHLPSAVSSLPLPIRFLFCMAEKHLSQHARQLRPTGLLVWTLLGLLCQGLEDGEMLELVSTQPLERGAKERLALLSECLQVSLGQQKGVPKPTVHKILQGLEEKRPKWSSMQLQKARKLCSESVLERVESGLVQERGGSNEPAEQKMWSALLALCQGAGGIQNLQQIHHTIQLNEAFLRSKLTPDEDPSTSSLEGCPSVQFSLATDRSSPLPLFNPLYHFDHIGHATFDQSAVSERKWDWARLLSTNQRMSQVTFRTLLTNRWEMQDAAPLEDEERILVEHLKKTYLSRAPDS